MRRILLSCFFLLLVSACVQNGGSRLALYLIEKDNKDLTKVELASEPLLTDADIIEYQWADHTIQITEQAAKRIPISREVGTGGKAFVIVVDNKVCYRGAFWTGLSSVGHFHPVIMVDRADLQVIKISRMYPNLEAELEPDPRDDGRIRKVLKALGKLKEG